MGWCWGVLGWMGLRWGFEIGLECKREQAFEPQVSEPQVSEPYNLTRAQQTRPVYVRYLVDPASSHMLVLKIKPCMSKYKPLYGETANGSLYQL